MILKNKVLNQKGYVETKKAVQLARISAKIGFNAALLMAAKDPATALERVRAAVEAFEQSSAATNTELVTAESRLEAAERRSREGPEAGLTATSKLEDLAKAGVTPKEA